MTTTVNRAGFWNETVWASIDDGVKQAVGSIRVAQKVFPTVKLADVTSVPADIFNPERMSIEEGVTRPYVELSVEFPLTNGQVNADPAGRAAITLAKMTGKNLALAEDRIILLGKYAALPDGVRIESGEEAIGDGIIGLVSEWVRVSSPDADAPTNSGGKILLAVTQGIAELTKQVQGPPFALIEDTNAFAATWGSVINGAPASTVLSPVLTGGIYETGAMPPNTGLLIALGGDPTSVYFSDDPMTEPTHQGRGGRYFFRTFERVQYVARDRRAFVGLDFSYLAEESEEQEDEAEAVRVDGREDTAEVTMER
jgi:uncharacterized linocin/CFP29 family protein